MVQNSKYVHADQVLAVKDTFLRIKKNVIFLSRSEQTSLKNKEFQKINDYDKQQHNPKCSNSVEAKSEADFDKLN